MTEPQSWSGPGIILSFPTVREDSPVTLEVLHKWFTLEARQQMIESGAVTWVSCYMAANPTYDKQCVYVYKVPDMALVHAGKLKAISRRSKLGLFEGDLEADKLVKYDSRLYSLAQQYETSKQDDDAAPTIMLAMMQPPPGGEPELDAWYRDEHNEQMSQQPGWRRTSRYRLLYHYNSGEESQELSFLAVHEFGPGHNLGKEVKAIEPISDWTKKVMSEAKAIDAAIYHAHESSEEGLGS